MSTTGESQVAYRRFSGYTDPRYPEGQWVGSVTVSGDGSGGTTTASLIFAPATAARLNSRMFSLEELGVSVDGTSSATGRLSTDNLGLDGPASLQHRLAFSLTATGQGSTLQPDAEEFSFLPLYLGAMRLALVNTRILFVMSNPGVGDDLRLEGAGYWWGPRSILVDGGAQRPPTGLYVA